MCEVTRSREQSEGYGGPKDETSAEPRNASIINE